MNKITIKTIFLLFIIISIKAMSQTLDTTPGANNLNPNLDKYVGTWKWEGNGKTFTWIIKKQNIPIPPFDRNVKADIIYGFHKYTEGGIIIENSLNYSSSIFGENKNTIFGGMGRAGLGNVLTGNIKHISKNRKSINFKIEYIDSSHIKLISLENPPGVKLRLSSEPAYDWSISLPQDIILTKQ